MIRLQRNILLFLTIFFVSILKLSAQTLQMNETFYDVSKRQIKERYYINASSNNRDSLYQSYFQNGQLKSKGYFYKGKQTGNWEYYYENGQLKMNGQMNNGVRVGPWEYFYESGIIQMEGVSDGSSKVGEWIFYYENGEVRARGTFVDSKKEGAWTYYYEDGSLKAMANYHADNGEYMEFYPSGKLKSQGPIVNGQSNGVWTYYNEDGTVQSKGKEVNGQREGEWIIYHPNGEIAAKGFYQNGKQVGKWTYYHDNGMVSEEGVMTQDGVKDGVWKMYYRSGQYKGESTYVNGEGEYKEYYENGKLKAIGKIVNDKNEGVWKYYYQTGELEGTCSYVNGKGLYKGYYENGKLKMEGQLDNGNNVGLWTIYNEDGTVAGYYKTYYDAIQTTLPKDTIAVVTPPKDSTNTSSTLPKISLPKKKSRYFTARINEARGYILSSNPFYLLFYSFPVTIEYYLQERQGYEFGVMYHRKPMFSSHNKVSPGNIYNTGYEIFLRQKFYQKDKDYGMLYFAHEIRGTLYIYENNYKDISAGVIDPVHLSQNHTRIEYSILIGDRFLPDQRRECWTFDLFLGMGIGYQSINPSWDGDVPEYRRMFSSLNNNQLVFPFRFGFTAGYKFNRKN